MLTTTAARTAELIDAAPGLWGHINHRPLRRVALAPEPQKAPALDLTAMTQLWRELQSMSAHEVDTGLTHLLKRLCQMLNADAMRWQLQGTLRSGKTMTLASQHWSESLELHDDGLCSDGPELTQSLPTPNKLTMHFTLVREASGDTFSGHDRQMLELALGGLSRWLNWLALSHGPLSPSGPMPPHQRKVLLLLVTGRSEKQIASDLNLSTNTAHQYVTALYRRYGVRNRPSLAAQWLGGC